MARTLSQSSGVSKYWFLAHSPWSAESCGWNNEFPVESFPQDCNLLTNCFCINKNEVWKIKIFWAGDAIILGSLLQEKKTSTFHNFLLLPFLILFSSFTYCLMSPKIFLQRTFPQHITQLWKETLALVIWPEKNRLSLKKTHSTSGKSADLCVGWGWRVSAFSQFLLRWFPSQANTETNGQPCRHLWSI